MILSFVLFFFVFPLLACAQNEDYSPVLDPIIISANRSDFSLSHTAQSMSVYTRQDIKKLPAHNLAEALSYMTGISIQTSGPFGQSSSVSMRGASSRQVLVMVDGIPFNTQLSGQSNLSSIPLENIERIEVIRGGDSSAWGSGLGGLINVITRPTGTGQKSKIKLSSSFAQYAQSKNSLEVSGGVDKFGFISMGSFLHSDGNLAQSRTQEIKTFTKTSYDFNDSTKLKAAFGYSGSQLRYGPTKDSLIYDQPYISRYGQLGLDLDKNDSHWQFAYKYNDQDITTNTYDSATWSASSLYPPVISHDLYQGVSLVGRHQIGLNNVLTTGYDFDWHAIKTSPYLTKAKSINMQAPFVNDVWTLNNFDIQPGIRFDHNSQFGSQLSPSLGGVYHISGWDDAYLKLRASRVFSAPPLLWVYNNYNYFGYQIIPNSDLKAERAYSYDTSFSFKPFSPLIVSLEGYYSDVKDGIANVVDGTNIQSRNFKKFRRQGGQMRLDYKINQHWLIYTSGEFNDVMNIQTKSLVRDANVNREAFKWGSHYDFNFGFGINLEGYYSRSLASADSPANDRKPMFDLKLTQEFKDIIKNTDLEMFLSLHNITNSTYWINPIFPYPKRYIEGGFSLTF